MNAKYRSLLCALVLVCTFLAAPSAHAIVINASDYAVGTNLTSAFPGVTLEYATLLFGQVDNFSSSPLVVGTYTGQRRQLTLRQHLLTIGVFLAT